MNRRRWVLMLTLSVSIALVISGLNYESAMAGKCRKLSNSWFCMNQDGEWIRNDGESDGGGGGDSGDKPRGGDPVVKPPWEKWQEKFDDWKANIERIDRHNGDEAERYQDEYQHYLECMAQGQLRQRCIPPTPPDYRERPAPPDGEGWVVPPVPDVPQFTPPEAAWEVIKTKLKIPKIKAGIGPSPEANRWSMAVVGFPYWLWADGETEASVEAKAGDLHVSLDARVSGLVFDMGDGNTVECKGTGSVWDGSQHRDDKAPEPSPTCGHVWKKVSGVGESYTVSVTTYWAVDWTAGGESGTEHLVDTTSRQVPVGELQSVIVGDR